MMRPFCENPQCEWHAYQVTNDTKYLKLATKPKWSMQLVMQQAGEKPKSLFIEVERFILANQCGDGIFICEACFNVFRMLEGIEWDYH